MLLTTAATIRREERRRRPTRRLLSPLLRLRPRLRLRSLDRSLPRSLVLRSLALRSCWRQLDVAGRSQNSLVTGLARHGADLSPATLTGTCAAAGALLAPLEAAVTARSRGSWHLHADETSWRVFAPREPGGPARWWLWVFLGPDTACFVMDPTRSGAVLARHAGIDQTTGQLVEHPEGVCGAGGDRREGPRQLVISSDFYSVYTSAGRKACRPGESLLLGARAPVLRAGRGRQPRPADVLDRRLAGADQEPVRRPRAAEHRVGRRCRRRTGARTHSLGRGARRHRTPSAPSRWLRPGCKNRPRRPWPRWTGNGTGWPPTATTR